MATYISFTEKELLRGRIVTPGWYLMHIDKISERLSKDGGSTNYVVEGTIVKNADDGSEEFAGQPIEWNFNSKAPGFMRGFFESIGTTLEPNKRYDLAFAEGKELDVMVENDMWNDRQVNRVNHKYRQPRT